MLRSLKDLERYGVRARDGDIGSVEDFLLDDERWVVRYLVVETGGFLDRRRVLISPISFREVDWVTRRFHLALTKEKVQNSPSIDVAEPVSRQYEEEYYGYFGYPHYWGGSAVWGMGAYPGMLMAETPSQRGVVRPDDVNGDVHLRSARDVQEYDVQGSDAAIGRVDDFIIDDETWEVRYLVIDTSHWWSGRRVLVSPHWASRVSWYESKVHVDLTRETIRNAPEWKANTAVTREYEARLHDYYGRAPYWGDGAHPPGAELAHQSSNSRRFPS